MQRHSHYHFLMQKLHQISYLVVENKLLACPSSADTIMLDNYLHDIFRNEGSMLSKLTLMLNNLRTMLTLEAHVAS